ncbi:MAG: NAD(P)/FAD-dependent oxidoreductase [Verrucomicrobiota bacterium]
MKNIAIIGGGFTGLVAAKNLTDCGHRVTIYESGKELGGLAACFELGGTPLEKAYHHLFRTDTAILSLIEELGIQDHLVWRASSLAIYRNGRIWPFMSPLDLLRFGACSLVGRIRTGLVAIYLKKTRNWQGLAGSSAMQWMSKYCGTSAADAIWSPLLRGKFADTADNVSMAWLWARLHVRSNSREPGEGEKLGYINGGFVKIVDALEKRILATGAVVQLDSPVKQVSHNGTQPTVEVDGQVLSYDAVLFTGSNRALERILPNGANLDGFRDDLGKINYLGSLCHVFTSSQNLADHYWININEAGAPFLVLIQHTNLIPVSCYGGKHVYYIGAYLPQEKGRFLMPETELIQEWHQYLKVIYPAFDPTLIEESHLFRFRDAQHVAEIGYESRILPYHTPIPGVFLSNFSQIFPEDRGTNFAVNEGNKVGCVIGTYLQHA